MENRNYSTLAGQIHSRLWLNVLTARLRSKQVQAQLRESSHFEGGQYICIDAPDDSKTDCSIEKVSQDEFLVRGDADTVPQMCAVAQLLSAALAELGIGHRLEVYDEQEHLAQQFQHRQEQPG